MEIGSNPSPVNSVTFYYRLLSGNFLAQSGAPNNRHTYLTGLKISFTKLTGDDYQVDIVWNDYDVKNDVRWCGDIILKEQVNLKTNKIITLDQSRTANQISRDAVSGEFTPTTTFACESGSTFHVEQNAQVIVQNKSVLRLEAGSLFRLETGSILRIKTGCKLILEPNSTLENNGGRIIIEDGATVEYGEASISLITTTSTLEIAGLLDLKAPVLGIYNTFTFTGNGTLIFNSPQVPAYNVVCASNCRIELSGAIFLKVLQDKLRIPAGIVDFNMLGGTCQLAGGKAIEVMSSATQVSVWYTTVTSTSVTYNSHKGLQLKGNPGLLAFSNFLNGNYGLINVGGLLQAAWCNFQYCGFGLYASGGRIALSHCTFDQNTSYGISANSMTQPSDIIYSTIQNTLTSNGYGIYYDGGLTSALYIEGNTITNNKVGMWVKNAKVSGPCNHINDNQTYGLYITNGATLDFASNAQGAPQNDVSSNPVSLKLGAAKNLFLADGYNDLTPNVSGTQNAVKGTIQKTCSPPPTAVNASRNIWNANGTFSTVDYALTTTIGSLGCTTAMPVTINDPLPSVYNGCGSPPAQMMASSNPIYNCSTCDFIYTPNFNSEKLNEASQQAMQAASDAGGNDYVGAVGLFNEMLMYSLPTPDTKEKYVLNYSYAKMGDALGDAFKAEQIVESDNSVIISDDVQNMIEVVNKEIAEAIANGNYLDRYYASIDKINIYRLAQRRDLAFPILDDMYTWTQAVEMEYLDYKNCATHLEQDLIDGLISYDDFYSASETCEQGSSGLRVMNMTNSSGSSISDNNNPSLRSTKKQELLSSAITISPNPATNKLAVYSSYDKTLSVIMKDVYGKIIYSGKAGSLSTIDCAPFARGVYAINFVDETGKILGNSKVVLQ